MPPSFNVMSGTRGAVPPPGNGDDDLLPPETEVTSAFIPQRRKRGRQLVLQLTGLIRKNPVILGVAAVLIYVFLGWTGYLYHVVKNRFFGTFVPHEKLLCRDEGMMLYVQRIMWARAKGEIANIIPDEQKDEYYSMSRKHVDKEIIELHKSGRGMNMEGEGAGSSANDIYTTTKDKKAKVDALKLLKYQHEMKTKHADNFSPSVPRNSFQKKKGQVHKRRIKAMKEAAANGEDNNDDITIQHHLNYIDVRSITRDPLDEEGAAGTVNEMDPLNPYAKVRVTSDMGFYQHSFGTVDVTTISRMSILGQSIGAYNTGNGFSTIVYYRIWKCANDYIRGMLYQYAQKKRVVDGETPLCVNLKDCKEHGYGMHTPGDRLRAVFFPASLRRFPFTFVRNPLERFVSGYTEIEYRYYQAAEYAKSLGMPTTVTPSHVNSGANAMTVETDEKGAPVLVDPREKGDKKGNIRIDWSVSSNGQRVKKIRKGVSTAINPAGERSRNTMRDRNKRRTPGTTGVGNVIRNDRRAKVEAGLDVDAMAAKRANPTSLSDAAMMGVPVPTGEEPEVKQTQILKVMPLRHPLGSVLRFTEFIDMILHFDGSRRLFKTYDNNYEMAHIAPQIGPLITASQAEALPMKQYRLEDFSAEWKRLGIETGQPRLLEIRDAIKNHTKLWQHPSSADQHHTKEAAKELLDVSLAVTRESVVQDIESGRIDQDEEAAAVYEVLAAHARQANPGVRGSLGSTGGSSSGDIDAHISRLLSSDNNWQDDPEVAEAVAAVRRKRRSKEQRRALVARAQRGMPHELLRLPMYRTLEIGYTRALCRLYMSDYVCTDYDLPYICQDLHAEVEELETSWERVEDRRYQKHGSVGMSILHSLLPHWLLYSLAEIPCTLLSTSPPTCVAMFVHGDHIYDDEDEELGHEEL